MAAEDIQAKDRFIASIFEQETIAVPIPKRSTILGGHKISVLHKGHKAVLNLAGGDEVLGPAAVLQREVAHR